MFYTRYTYLNFNDRRSLEPKIQELRNASDEARTLTRGKRPESRGHIKLSYSHRNDGVSNTAAYGWRAEKGFLDPRSNLEHNDISPPHCGMLEGPDELVTGKGGYGEPVNEEGASSQGNKRVVDLGAGGRPEQLVDADFRDHTIPEGMVNAVVEPELGSARKVLSCGIYETHGCWDRGGEFGWQSRDSALVQAGRTDGDYRVGYRARG